MANHSSTLLNIENLNSAKYKKSKKQQRKEPYAMAALSQTELNLIRETVMSHQTSASKLSDYAGRCQDDKIKKMFQNASQEAEKSAQKLIQML